MGEARATGAGPMGAGECVLMIQPGEIYLADTEAGKRPALIVSREELNRGHWVVAVLITSTCLLGFESRMAYTCPEN